MDEERTPETAAQPTEIMPEETQQAESSPEEAQPAEPAPVDAREEERRKTHRRRMRALRSMLIRLGLLLLVVYILFFHLVGVTVMHSGDMFPRVDGGDLILFYRLEQRIRAQDVVVLEIPSARLESPDTAEETEESAATAETVETAGKPWWRQVLNFLRIPDPTEPPRTQFVCRVVAGPGDTVEISESQRLIVNGNAMLETKIYYQTPRYSNLVEYPVTLGENEYFVLADKRDEGVDSRFFGPVTKDEILGPVITILRRNNL